MLGPPSPYLLPQANGGLPSMQIHATRLHTVTADGVFTPKLILIQNLERSISAKLLIILLTNWLHILSSQEKQRHHNQIFFLR